MEAWHTIRQGFKRLKNTARTIKAEAIFAPGNFLRLSGIFTQRAFTGPLKVCVDITDKCDMHCIMCWYHSPVLPEQNRTPFFMPLARFSSLIKELKRINTEIIMISGEGESLLHPDIEAMLEAIHNSGMQAELMTNAYYLNKDNIDFFRKIRLKKLIVSLHAADTQTFNAIRPNKTPEDFKRIIDNLNYLKSASSCRTYLYIINVISRLNFQSVGKMAEFAQNIQADKLLFKPVRLVTDFPVDLKLSSETAISLIREFKKILPRLSIANNITSYCAYLRKNSRILRRRDNSLEKPRSVNQKNRSFCYIRWAQSVVRLKGDVFGCVSAQKIALGNIYNSSFGDIWFGREYSRFRRGFYCFSGCAARAVYPLLTV